jgi:tRNA 2-thiouridine synthesizing protein E
MIDIPKHDSRLDSVFNVHASNAIESNWTQTVAEQRASAMGIALTTLHWEVLYFLRNYYELHEPVQHARELTTALNAKFNKLGGLKYLYRLFPGGPVRQGCYIAGVLTPADASSASFGSAF